MGGTDAKTAEKRLNAAWVAVSAVFFAVLWALKIVENLKLISYHAWPVRILVPLYVLLTFLYSWYGPGKKSPFIAAALLFACLAEIINAANLDFGLLFFAVTHTMLAVYHWRAGKLAGKKAVWISLGVFIALYIIAVVLIEINLHMENVSYIAVVPAYMVFLTVMGWRSVCTYREAQAGRIIWGSILFYLCDVCILAELAFPDFSYPPLFLLVVSWLCYLPALFLLSLIDKNIFVKKV